LKQKLYKAKENIKMSGKHILLEPLPNGAYGNVQRPPVQESQGLSGYDNQQIMFAAPPKQRHFSSHPAPVALSDTYASVASDREIFGDGNGRAPNLRARASEEASRGEFPRPGEASRGEFSLQQMYQAFVTYFGNLQMTKKEDTNKHSVWVAQLPSFTENARVLYVITPLDYFISGNVQPLQDMKWVCLQTRTLPSAMGNIPVQDYPKKITPFLQTPISSVSQSKDKIVYKPSGGSSLPILVELLEHNGNTYGYSLNGFIHTAVETWHCVISVL